LIVEGQILGNRYELIEKIGGGGMALVYKAKCSLLNRL
jgi:serine/threonine-protein kinase